MTNTQKRQYSGEYKVEKTTSLSDFLKQVNHVLTPEIIFDEEINHSNAVYLKAKLDSLFSEILQSKQITK